MLPNGHRFQLSFDISHGDAPTVVQLPIIEYVAQVKDEKLQKEVAFRDENSQIKTEVDSDNSYVDDAVVDGTHRHSAVSPRRAVARSSTPRDKGSVGRNNEFKNVSSRQAIKMRNLKHWIHWFQTESDEPAHMPPPGPWPADKGLRYHDLYMQRAENGALKVWRYLPNNTGEDGKWVQLRVGAEVDVPGLAGPRVFVINKQGKPSFVLQGTVNKLYNELEK
ncbi:hypothetical protein QCA50_018314 [Cerrena zonata]|uniref:Uncharacterized protein n=1 Tax=Cerrena zonata TaxID=2478898 RepID=A0AAW0FN75_9APHY